MIALVKFNMMNQCFVAFIDLLGFSEMINTDCNDPLQEFSTLKNLIEVMESVSREVENQGNIGFIQSSDSIVLSAPFDRTKFGEFIVLCRNLQVLLFRKGILCRGGLAVGRHYHKSNFIFSEGLIETYRIESTTARVPRIIVSDNLLQLIAYPNYKIDTNSIISDKDQQKFIHYIENIESDFIIKFARRAKNSLVGQLNASIREKYTWMIDYISFAKPELNIDAPSFLIDF